MTSPSDTPPAASRDHAPDCPFRHVMLDEGWEWKDKVCYCQSVAASPARDGAGATGPHTLPEALQLVDEARETMAGPDGERTAPRDQSAENTARLGAQSDAAIVEASGKMLALSVGVLEAARALVRKYGYGPKAGRADYMVSMGADELEPLTQAVQAFDLRAAPAERTAPETEIDPAALCEPMSYAEAVRKGRAMDAIMNARAPEEAAVPTTECDMCVPSEGCLPGCPRYVAAPPNDPHSVVMCGMCGQVGHDWTAHRAAAPTPTGDAVATTCSVCDGDGSVEEGYILASDGTTSDCPRCRPVPAPAVAVPREDDVEQMEHAAAHVASVFKLQQHHEGETEKSGLRPLSTASTDDAREATVCANCHIALFLDWKSTTHYYCHEFTRETTGADAVAEFKPPQLAAVESVPGFSEAGLLAVGQALLDYRAALSTERTAREAAEQVNVDMYRRNRSLEDRIVQGRAQNSRLMARQAELNSARTEAERRAEALRDAIEAAAGELENDPKTRTCHNVAADLRAALSRPTAGETE